MRVSISMAGESKMKPVLLILALCATVGLAGLPDPPFKVELQKLGDSVGITTTADAALITITSERGIGGAKLILTGHQWPTHLTLHLNLKDLEGFEMNNGIIHINTFRKGPKQVPYWKAGKSENQSDPPDGTLEVAITKTDEAIEIIVPKEMLEGHPQEISFGWIDFYR